MVGFRTFIKNSADSLKSFDAKAEKMVVLLGDMNEKLGSIDEKQDMMLEKQDSMLEKQDDTIGEIRNVSEKIEKTEKHKKTFSYVGLCPTTLQAL